MTPILFDLFVICVAHKTCIHFNANFGKILFDIVFDCSYFSITILDNKVYSLFFEQQVHWLWFIGYVAAEVTNVVPEYNYTIVFYGIGHEIVQAITPDNSL